MKVKYRFNWNKAVEAVVWLSANKPGIDIYHIAKVLFFAEKMHINLYARPIIGDTYIRMEHGPVPSSVLNLAKRNEFVHPDLLEAMKQSVEIDYPDSFRAKREPETNLFSQTDIECLNESLKQYGDASFDDLWSLTHEEDCWLKADPNQPIDYLLMVDDDNPLKEDIIREMHETSMYLAL